MINIGVGKSGDPLEKAKHALEELTGEKPSVRGARKSVRDFGIHKGEPIGTMVTLRRESAVKFLKSVLESTRNTMKASSFDSTEISLSGSMSILIYQEQNTIPILGYLEWTLVLC